MSKSQQSHYNQTGLSITIDTFNLSAPSNIATEQEVNELRQSLLSCDATVSLENHEYIVHNKYGSSICKINNYLKGTQKKYEDVSNISIYGISQVYYEQATISKEHQVIIKWAAKYEPQIISIDYAYDHWYGYLLSISNYNNKSDQLNQNDYSLNHLTKFATHSIFIPLQDNDNLIYEIKKKIINKQVLSDEVSQTANYYQYNYLNDNFHKEFKKTINNTKNNATHIKLSIKDAKSYFIYFNLIKEYTLNVEYSMSSANNENVIILSNKLSVDVINYDKYSRDQDNGYKEPYIIGAYKRLSQQYEEVSYQHFRQNRTEIRRCYKKYNLIITPSTINDVMEFISNDVKELSDKVKITIFPSKTKLQQYQKALRQHKIAKAKNKYSRNTLNINDYGKTLSINTKQIDTMINKIKVCFTIHNKIRCINLYQPCKEETKLIQQPCKNLHKVLSDTVFYALRCFSEPLKPINYF